MEKKLLIGLCVVAIVTVCLVTMKLYGMVIPPSFSKALPDGPYKQTCRAITMRFEGSMRRLTEMEKIVEAECQMDNGNWKKSSVKIPFTVFINPFTIINQNGELKVEEKVEVSTYQPLYDPLFKNPRTQSLQTN